MLQMVSAGRGVAALPGWLVDTYAKSLQLVSLRLGSEGIMKHIYLGMRNNDVNIDYIADFVRLAKQTENQVDKG